MQAADIARSIHHLSPRQAAPSSFGAFLLGALLARQPMNERCRRLLCDHRALVASGLSFLVEKADFNRLLAGVKEMEELLQFPTVAGHVEKADKLALLIARNAPNGAIANLAMRAISEAHALRGGSLPLRADRTKLNQTLWHLRLAIQEVKSAKPDGE